MSMTESNESNARNPPAGWRGSSSWLLRIFPGSSQLSILLRAVTASVGILLLEFLVEVLLLDLPYWKSPEAFMSDPGVILGALGLVFGFILLGQWGERYIELWKIVRPAFDVENEEYRAAVRRNLDNLYGRDHIPFLMFVVVQVGVYGVYGHELPAGYLHVGFLHFLGVTALYSFYRHTVTIRSVMEMPLTDISRARSILAEIADYSVAVCLNWFGALAAVSIYIGFFMGLNRNIGVFYAILIAFFVAIGLLVFAIPVVLIHEALVEAKSQRLRELRQEYDTLFDEWQTDTLAGDPSVGLEILETRRRNVETLSTWPYKLASVGKIAVGSVVPAAISVIQTFVG